MRKNLYFLFALALTFLGMSGFSSLSHAAPLEVAIGTGQAEGSYSRFINQVAQVCSNDKYAYKSQPSGGSPDNLNMLLGNEIPAGIGQLDVGDLFRNTRDVSQLRLLLPLFPEQAHFITRANFGKKQAATLGGVNLSIGGYSPGGTDIVLNSVNDLRGRVVASAGGSYYTAQMLAHPNVGNLQMTLKELTGPKANSDAIQGVLAGTYDAALIVSAAPAGVLGNFKDQQPQLKLLPIGEDIYSKIIKFYPSRDSVSYRDMGQNGTNISTFQVMSALLVPNYTKGPFVGAFSNLRKCILENAEDQASMPKTHPAWRYIATHPVANVGNWTLWDEPGQKPAAGATAKKK